MNKLRSCFLILCGFLVAWTPFGSTYAQVAPMVPLNNEQMAMNFQHGPSSILVTARDQNLQERRLEIPYTPKEELKKHSPSALKKYLLQPALHTTMRFPLESTMFFTAIGAVTLFQLTTDYSGNPMRMAQHIEHSVSPLGMFSFLMFMQANNITSNALGSVVKNPHFHKFIPYLGMTAGFFVQSTVSTLAADPNVKACVAGMLGKTKKASEEESVAKDPCEAAFNWYVIKNHIYTLAPGLVSMLASTALAGAIGIAAHQAFRVTGYQFLLYLVPGGGMMLTGGRLMIASMVNMGLFYYIDVGFLNRLMMSGWKNLVDGRRLLSYEQEITGMIARKKATAWADVPQPKAAQCEVFGGKHCERDLSVALKEFHEQMANWRMANLMPVYEAHQGWQDLVAKVGGQYQVAYEFYRDFIEEARNSKWRIRAPYRLDMADPLYGVHAVSPKRITPLTSSYLYGSPHIVTTLSSNFARHLGQKLQKSLDAGKEWTNLNPYEKGVVTDIISKLQSEDVNVQGQAIQIMNREINLGRGQGVGSVAFITSLDRIRSQLGPDPQALTAPGLGFLRRFENHSDSAKNLKSVNYTGTGLYTKNITDQLVLQMLCGPDVDRGEELLKGFRGFNVDFTPPRITDWKAKGLDICTRAAGKNIARLLYETPVTDGKNNYASYLDALKQNIRPQILGDENEESASFLNWWESVTGERMKKTYESLAEKYDGIIVQLVRTLRQQEDSSINMGPLANGTIESARQQVRLDLLILGEMLKDLYEDQNKQTLPATLFNSNPEPVPAFGALKKSGQARFERPQILSMLRYGGLPANETPEANTPIRRSILEWDRLAAATPLGEGNQTGGKAPRGHALQLQKEVEFEFEKLMYLVSQIQIVTVDGRKRIQSPLKNKDYEEQSKLATEKAQSFAALLLPEEGKAGSLLKPLSREKRELVQNIIESLNAVAQELSLYGTMANAVSWDKIRDLDNASEQQQKFLESQNRKMKQMGAGSARSSGM
ncbi:MAG: hypothetical protein KF865_09265 [Bdellovibrionaceae bacterium]|nr:hypothetical protein [Pseudobdellovibrionaceae bacterium]